MNHRVENLADRVDEYLARMDVDPERNAEGIYMIRFGSTVVMVSLFEEQGRSYVRFASTMLTDVHPGLDLIVRLLRLNAEVLFGAFQLFEDNTVSFTHTLLGDFLDFEEFQHALAYVARVSDDHDEALQALGGGLRAEDVLASEQIPTVAEAD
jgi:hypothetical protein